MDMKWKWILGINDKRIEDGTMNRRIRIEKGETAMGNEKWVMGNGNEKDMGNECGYGIIQMINANG